MQRRSLHYLYVLAVPLTATIGCVSGIELSGIRHTGFIWPLMMVVGALLLLARRERSAFPWIVWLPWYAMMTFSFAWSELTLRPNLQDCLQLLTPPMVGLIAGCVRYDQQMLQRFFRTCVFCSIIVVASFVLFRYGLGNVSQQGLESAVEDEGIAFGARSAAMTLCIFACVFVARARQNGFLGIVGWLACLSVCVLSGSRTASAATLILWCVVPRYDRFVGRVLGVAIMLLAAIVAFATPAIQERFFAGRSGSLSDVSFDVQTTQGRSYAWPLIWEEAKKRPIIGHGVGSSKLFVPRVWPDIDKPHNDYLRVVFEVGYPGLALFVLALLWQLVDLWKTCRADTQHANWPATAAFCGFVTLSIIAVTDNPIIYGVWYMNPLFALLGIAYAIRYQQTVEGSDS